MNESSERASDTDRLFVNPITYGRTSEIEAYRIAMCPVCYWPSVSAIMEFLGERPAEYRCTVKYQCGRGHPWRTSWSGESQVIHRDAA